MKSLVTIALGLLLPMCVYSSQQGSSISGHITDSEGAAIANARVIVHWDPSGSETGLRDNIGIREDMSATTDAAGAFEIAVPAGFYDVIVSGPAFTPIAAKVRIKPNQHASFNGRLAAAPLVCRELCDDFHESKQP